jgi:hypothetical protein
MMDVVRMRNTGHTPLLRLCLFFGQVFDWRCNYMCISDLASWLAHEGVMSAGSACLLCHMQWLSGCYAVRPQGHRYIGNFEAVQEWLGLVEGNPAELNRMATRKSTTVDSQPASTRNSTVVELNHVMQ